MWSTRPWRVAFERVFGALCARGPPLDPAPEKLLRAMLLQVLYTIRSERQLMERLEFGSPVSLVVGMGVDDRAWDHSTCFPRTASGCWRAISPPSC